MIIEIAIFTVGFITGILVGRNNRRLVEKTVQESLELYEKAQEELEELKAKRKPAKKKTVVKKQPTVD